MARSFWLHNVAPAPGIDFYQFWIVARTHASAGQREPPYSEPARARLAETGRRLAEAPGSSPRLRAAAAYRARVETYSTPFLYQVIGPLAGADYDAAYRRFAALGMAALVAGVVLLCWHTGSSVWLIGLWLAMLLGASEPVRSDARVGNVNALQLGALALYLALARLQGDAARAAAGALLGLLVAFKPTLAVVAVFVACDAMLQLELRRLSVEGGAFAAAILLAVAASSAYFDSGRVWLDWQAALPALFREADVSVANGNFAPTRFAAERGIPVPAVALALAPFAAFAACAWRSAGRQACPYTRARIVVALAATASVVGAPLAWLHYYVLVVPLAIFLLRPRVPVPVLAAAALASVLLQATPLRVLAPALGVGAHAAAMITGALVVYALGLLELARVDRPVGDAPPPLL